jgi:hypothetical protein
VIECLREGGSHGTDLSGDSVRCHRDELAVGRQSRGLRRVQDRVPMGAGSVTGAYRRRGQALRGNWSEHTEVARTGEGDECLGRASWQCATAARKEAACSEVAR